jgi:hypothetical protein
MRSQRPSNQDRRRFAGASATVVAAAATLSLLTVAATEVTPSVPSTSPFWRSNWWTSAGAAATRWPGKENVADKSLGVQLATVEQLGRYRQTATTGARRRLRRSQDVTSPTT